MAYQAFSRIAAGDILSPRCNYFAAEQGSTLATIERVAQPVRAKNRGRALPYRELPRTLGAVNACWIAAALEASGHAAPKIDQLLIEPVDANCSTTARLHLRGSANGEALPTTMFLKLCPPGHDFLGASEIAYYTRDYRDLKAAPLIHCYAAIGPDPSDLGSSVGAGYALLLADLTADYIDNKVIPPTAAHARRLGGALGKLHAHRRGVAGDPDGPHNLDADLDRYLDHVAKGLEPVLEVLGNEIDAPSRDRLRRVFDEDVERMRRRARTGEGVALLHGDPNPTNVLTHRNQTDPALGGPALYLIDRQPFTWSLRLWLGAIDLVHASVPYWSPKARRDHEHDLMRGYHHALLEGGVSDHSWERLVEDWRACLCQGALIAVEWGAESDGIENMRWLWQDQLNRALQAMLDWDDA
ncbi:phosphotransferase [Palleronia sp.]|uniref:phosphotransferase n=1 Tax=Palleronia sp. TaxID=1940284 RepID=UPI0035C7DCFB